MSDLTPEQLRQELARMSRRRFLGRSSLALGGLALGPTLLAACGGGDDGGGGGGGGGGEAADFTPTTSDTLRISNWPFYIDEETVGLFETESGLTVDYREDVNDNEEYFARIREPLSRGDDIGADMFIVTDFMVNRLIGLGWLAPLDDANIPNKANLVGLAAGHRLRPRPDLQPPLVLGLHRPSPTTRS